MSRKKPFQQKTTLKRLSISGAIVAVVCVSIIVSWGHSKIFNRGAPIDGSHINSSQDNNHPHAASTAVNAKTNPTVEPSASRLRPLQHTSISVDLFGGSAAYGELDPNSYSYLQRAFAQLDSHSPDIRYTIHDHTHGAMTAYLMETREPGLFEADLNKDKPQIVVLSWGLLNDIASRNKVNVNTFGKAMRKEMQQALAAHATVLLITPPVTVAGATMFQNGINEFTARMFAEGQSFHTPNVIDVPLFQQMLSYMKAHHITYAEYRGNNWHPNQAGHKVAGALLAKDLQQLIASGKIQ